MQLCIATRSRLTSPTKSRGDFIEPAKSCALRLLGRAAQRVIREALQEHLQRHAALPRQRIHMRLIPMGDGYRYAGRGVWFDGIRGDAQLFDGPSRSVACSVIAS